jgi:serine/threonine-protein kinase
MTETGMSLGTPHYMSPEQAMGEREVTARSDVYALGCVTYEMLLGEPPFTGPTAQAIVAKVVTEEPRPLTLRRSTVPAHVEAAVLTALQKLPADRFASAVEFAGALGFPNNRPTVPRPVGISRPGLGPRRSLVGLLAGTGLVAFLLGGAGTMLWLRPGAPNPLPIQASLLPPPGCVFAHVVEGAPQLGPDAKRLVFLADCAGSKSLWIRTLATGRMERLEGTTGGQYPFWSPDGNSLGFFAGGMLKRVELETGVVRNVAPAPAGRGGTWSPNGTIVYAPDIFGPLVSISSAGGTAQPATTLADTGQGAFRLTHRNPYFLPDGQQFLFNEGNDSGSTGATRLGRLGTTESRQVLEVGSNVAYAQGRLIYVSDGILVARPFNPARGDLPGTAGAMVPGIETYLGRLLGSHTAVGGYLVYKQAVQDPSRIALIDPTSGVEQPVLPEGMYAGYSLSPDRHRLLVARTENGEAEPRLWLYDLEGGSWARVTEERSQSYLFGWFPDGQRYFYSSSDLRQPLRIINVGNGEILDSVTRESSVMHPLVSVAPDGSFGIGARQVKATGFDILRVDLRKAGGTPAVLLASPANEAYATVSPDGRLLAYLSDRTGRFEVMATSLPGASIQWQLSREGATNYPPAWSSDGRTLYYIDASGRLSAIDVSRRTGLRFGTPRGVPRAPPKVWGVETTSHGQLALWVGADEKPAPLTLVTDWQRMLQETR